MKQPVTIVEIAKESGVSIATVSRVLNDSAPVAEATRARVNEVIHKHAYVPNSFAKGLSRRKSMILGVILPDIVNPYFAGMFQQIERAAYEAQYSVFLRNTDVATARQQSELDSFQMMIRKNVDGVLLVGGQGDLPQTHPAYTAALQQLCRVIPTVALGRPIPGVDCRFIQRELGQGVLLAIRHLLALGHRRIGFIGGQAGEGITEARLAAYRNALNTSGSLYDRQLVALTGFETPGGYRGMRAVLASGSGCTAVLTMNDNVALGAYRALADAGLRVAGDLSIISCDQFFSADYFVPRLTSVDQHNERFARYVVDALLRTVNGAEDAPPLDHQPELVVRESCAPPPTPTGHG